MVLVISKRILSEIILSNIVRPYPPTQSIDGWIVQTKKNFRMDQTEIIRHHFPLVDLIAV